ncbi:LytR family transcriptional regulator [Georgenia sp. 311]|uniref:LytR C-terminal domain-containing protein n=1 Tax=Georgenia sp. 311 TaxID=2585134 RepID=UPI0011128555|nr:LytR C-terminal domain-containing protein [Georgenia sp. 311]TNC16903.1 LytR family transcriptional regulator [Georgenia sp. 311]
MSEYPEDEFDVAARDRGPEGVHREPPSLWRALAPFLAVIVIVPLLAWGAVSLLSDNDGDDAPLEPVPAATAPATEEPAPGETAEPTPTPAEEPSEPAVPDVVRTASISVLNGAGVNGLAGRVAGELQADGFTTVGAADYTSGTPDVTTLYYRNAELAPTAQAIGTLLGIDNLVESPAATQNVEIAIVLRADYTGR